MPRTSSSAAPRMTPTILPPSASPLRVPLGLLLALSLTAGTAACGPGDDGAGAAATGNGAAPGNGSAAAGAGGATGVEVGSARAGSLEIRDAVVTEPVTGERSALYLTVTDVSGAGDVLLGVDAAGAGRASLHRTEQGGGDAAGMTMRPVDSLIVQPGDRLLMRPGGIHGMLEELEGRWRAGDTVAVTLRFRQAGAVELRAPVVEYGALDRLFPPTGGG